MSLRARAFAVFAGLGFAVLGGCGSQSSLDAGTACGKDGDCPSGQTCRMPKTPGQKPQMTYNPCMTLVGCADSAQCASGLVCGPYSGLLQPNYPNCPTMVCQAPCQAGSCPMDQVCADDGVCRFRSCDESGAPACSEHFRCDPAAAVALDSNPGWPQGSSLADSADPARELARGCVRKLCNEDGGYVCRELWSCDPPNATKEPSGCTPDPCAESGKCESDYYICKPTSDGPRPSGTDVHGCVARNCDEGYQCVYMPGTTNYSHCDVGAAGADTYGCVITQCDELPGCTMGYVCDPGSTGSDPRGCRYGRCDEAGGNACPQNYVCDPSSPSAGSNGCSFVPVSTGGAGGGGAGGGGGVGGFGVGGSGAIGPLGGSGGTAARGGSSGSSGSGGSSGAATGGSGASGGSGALGGGGTAGDGGTAGEMTGMCVSSG